MSFESIFIFPDTKVFPNSLGMNRMVDKLNWDQNEISWYFGHNIVKGINNTILASVKQALYL